MPLASIPPLSTLTSLGKFFYFFVSHLWTSLFLLLAIAVLTWWTYQLYSYRISTLSGIVTVDGQLLPNFRISLHHGTGPPFTWYVQQECTQGVYVIYDVRVGTIVVEFVWGNQDSCKMTATLDIKKGTNLLDIDVSLELEDLAAKPADGGKPAAVSWSFTRPTANPSPRLLEVNAIKFIYWVSHSYTDKSGSHLSTPLETPWPNSASPPPATPWLAEVSGPEYARSGDSDMWSVEVCTDGFNKAKKTTKTKK